MPKLKGVDGDPILPTHKPYNLPNHLLVTLTHFEKSI